MAVFTFTTEDVFYSSDYFLCKWGNDLIKLRGFKQSGKPIEEKLCRWLVSKFSFRSLVDHVFCYWKDCYFKKYYRLCFGFKTTIIHVEYWVTCASRRFYFCNTTLLFMYIFLKKEKKAPWQATNSELNRRFLFISLLMWSVTWEQTLGMGFVIATLPSARRPDLFILLAPPVIDVNIWIKYSPFSQTDSAVLVLRGNRRILVTLQVCFSSYWPHVCKVISNCDILRVRKTSSVAKHWNIRLQLQFNDEFKWYLRCLTCVWLMWASREE